MSSVVVRPGRPADFAAVGRVTVAAYRQDGQVFPGHFYEQTLADVAARAAAGELLVACERSADSEGTTVLGSVLFVLPGSPYAELSRPGEAEFRTLAVDPAAQHRGVGQALVRACVDRAVQHGCHAVVIYVRDIAKAAQRLYAQMGFIRIPERDWHPRPGVNLLALRIGLDRPTVQE